MRKTEPFLREPVDWILLVMIVLVGGFLLLAGYMQCGRVAHDIYHRDMAADAGTQ